MAPYLQLGAATGGVLFLGLVAHSLAGRRSLSGCLLVASISAACGAFLAIRVFGAAVLTDWDWLAWAGVASVVGLGTYFLFRSKR